MHPLFNQASAITHDVIGAAIEVHKDKGPGLLESVYEWCLTMELGIRGYQVDNQSEVIIRYKQFQKTVPLRFDLLVNRCLFVEVKAVETVIPIHKAQLLSYMKLLDIPLGLVINFNTPKLTDGIIATDPARSQSRLSPRRRQRQQTAISVFSVCSCSIVSRSRRVPKLFGLHS